MQQNKEKVFGYCHRLNLSEHPELFLGLIDPLDLSEADWEAIWAELRCDDLPSGVDFAAFDTGLILGATWLAQTVQAALGVEKTGVLDADAVAMVAAVKPGYLIETLYEKRMSITRKHENWRSRSRPIFANRLQEMWAIGMEMIDVSG